MGAGGVVRGMGAGMGAGGVMRGMGAGMGAGGVVRGSPVPGVTIRPLDGFAWPVRGRELGGLTVTRAELPVPGTAAGAGAEDAGGSTIGGRLLILEVLG